MARYAGLSGQRARGGPNTDMLLDIPLMARRILHPNLIHYTCANKILRVQLDSPSGDGSHIICCFESFEDLSTDAALQRYLGNDNINRLECFALFCHKTGSIIRPPELLLSWLIEAPNFIKAIEDDPKLGLWYASWRRSKWISQALSKELLIYALTDSACAFMGAIQGSSGLPKRSMFSFCTLKWHQASGVQHCSICKKCVVVTEHGHCPKC
ncbi:MAG: hypothetical protein MMC33_003419 [Icmadophila ericetorum]|nr:hypothetical protein [Icmadophila ericetorum]